MATHTPSQDSLARMTSPFLSPHIPMVHRHASPISTVPLSKKDRKRKPRLRGKGKKKKKKKKKKPSKKEEEEAGGGDITETAIKPKFDASHPYKLTSSQWVAYIMYCWGFFALGLFTSAPGPILPTLEAQVNVSLAAISYIFSARAVGFVVGSIISGYVMDRYQKYLISQESGTRFLLKKNQKIADYLWSLPKWTWWPMSAHNVFSISIIVAAITNAAIPYVHDVYSLSILVTINGICFGNINTFGNVLLLTLFDTEISHNIDFDIIYPDDDDEADDDDKVVDIASNAIKMDTIDADAANKADINKQNKKQNIIVVADDEDNDDDDDDDDDEEQELIEASLSSSDYGSVSREDKGETTMARMVEQDERVGPFMQFLQAIYALGGLLAPIFIQISFEISGGYAASFWFFTILYIPPGIILLFYPEPIRMSVVSERLKEIEKLNKSTISLVSEGGATDIIDEDDDNAAVAVLKAKNKLFWSRILCLGFAIFLLWYVGAQVGYGMYITTYSIDYLSTTPAIGRYLASANWAGLFAGRFLAVPISHKMSALNMVRIDLIGMTMGCFILFFSMDWQYIVWISSVVVGFCMASVWPSMFVWAEKLIPVTGIFASLMVGGGSLGEFIIPALQGNIMAAFGSQYFNHVMFAMSVFLLINLFINQIIAKRLAHFI